MSEERRPVEPATLAMRPVLLVAAVIIVAMLLAALAAFGFTRWRNVPLDAGPDTPPHLRPGVARLQPAPQDDATAYFEKKSAQLEAYAWVDRDAGVARIPIDEAMRILIQRRGGKP